MAKHARDDFEQARREAVASEPIAPISDHFARSSGEYQSALAFVSLAAFLRSWRDVRRRRRLGEAPPRVAASRRYTPKRRRP